jgi:hypothetical protein
MNARDFKARLFICCAGISARPLRDRVSAGTGLGRYV